MSFAKKILPKGQIEYDDIEIYPLLWLKDTVMLVCYASFPDDKLAVQIYPKVVMKTLSEANNQRLVVMYQETFSQEEVEFTCEIKLCNGLHNMLEVKSAREYGEKYLEAKEKNIEHKLTQSKES